MVNFDWLSRVVRIATLAAGISGAKKKRGFEFVGCIWRIIFGGCDCELAGLGMG